MASGGYFPFSGNVPGSYLHSVSPPPNTAYQPSMQAPPMSVLQSGYGPLGTPAFQNAAMPTGQKALSMPMMQSGSAGYSAFQNTTIPPRQLSLSYPSGPLPGMSASYHGSPQSVANARNMMRTNRGKDPEEDLQRQMKDVKRQFTNVPGQLREKELQEADLNEQLRERELQKEDLQRQLSQTEQQLVSSQRLVREQEQQLTHFQSQLGQQLREKEQQVENSQVRLREMEQQLRKEKGQVINLHVERQLRDRDQDLVELNKTLSEADKKLKEYQHHETHDWIIPRDQITLTDKLLGGGGWGYVIEGKYCGCSVAVKKLSEKMAISPYIQRKFEREMDIASKCRHTCLLQFIGATNDEESPLLVTELMESSLRELLKKRPLSETEVLTISLDVARALNYLHQKKPKPILHRDVSSANVLLWRRNDHWRGKVSDYGTANFLQDIMTASPGTMIYSAFEAGTRDRQTVKVDVYSFGVLLCEMCIREEPDPDRRDQQIAMVTNDMLRALIRRCVQTEPEARPSMEEIIEELERTV